THGGGEHGAGDLEGAGETLAAVFEDDGDGVPGVGVAGKTDEPGVGFAGAGFGGAGFAADDESVDGGAVRVAVLDDVDHHVADGVRGLGGDGPAPDVGSRAADDVAVASRDGVDEVGTHHVAAVGDGSRDHRHLE